MIDAFCCSGASLHFEEAIGVTVAVACSKQGRRKTCLEWVVKGVLVQGMCAVEQSNSHTVRGVLQTQDFKVHPLRILSKVHQLQQTTQSL